MLLLHRSQDKGFHVEKALLHVFSRSLPYTSAQTLKVEEAFEGEKVLYNIPAELSDFIYRGFLCSDSVHPVRLVQEFLLEGLADKWSVSMTTENVPFLLTAKQLQACPRDVDAARCYWVHLLQKDLDSEAQTCADAEKNQSALPDGRDVQETPSATCVTSDKVDRARSKGAEGFRSERSLDIDPDGGGGLYVLRPSLLPQMEELLTKKEELTNDAGSHGENEGTDESVEGRNNKKGSCGNCNGVSSLLSAISGLVFRNVSVNVWALPAFHELLIRGVLPTECKPIRFLRQRLEKLLAPYGVSQATEQGGLRLIAQPMGLVGRVFVSNANDNTSHISITVTLNLDLLATLLFSLPDWRLLWSHDPRFLEQYASRPSPGKPFRPLSLFPELITFDISFWTGPTWEESKFHAVVREASHGTVEQVKLIDTFSHPDLSQTSYCYRLTYHSHTHALSHTQALQFHQQLESLLSSRLQVTIR